jgi:hypothetical protein
MVLGWNEPGDTPSKELDVTASVRQDAFMKGKSGRRYRREKRPLVQLTARVVPQTRDQVNEVATLLGITNAEYIEQLVARDQLGVDGRPVWASEILGTGALGDLLPGLETAPAA